MNTLFKKILGLDCCKVFALVSIFLFIQSDAFSQCSIAAQDTVKLCWGQTYNLGSGITVSGTTGTVMYSWNGATPTSSPLKNVSPTVTTNYTLQITDGAGCIATKVVTVKVIPKPIVDAGPDVHICSGQSTTMCATASSANGPISLYNWISVGVGQCRTVSPASQTMYTLYAIDSEGCAATDNITVFVNPLPSVNAGADISMCLSQGSQQLTGTPSGGTWSGPNVTSGGLFTPPSANNYTLTYSYTNAQNCTNTDQVVVTVNVPAPINGGVDRELCLNSPAIQLPSVGNWSGSTSVNSTGLFTPSSVGTHNLTVTNTASGCPVTDNVIIQVLALPTVNAGIDVSICAGQCAQLNAVSNSGNGAINNIAWTGGTVSNSSISNPSACPTTNTTYTVQVTDIKNCQASDAIIVNVNAMPVVNAGSAITVCTNGNPVTLTGQTPTGGVWSGPGVTASGVFTPSAAGDVNLTYTYTSGVNCSSSSTRTIHVVNPSPLNAGSDIEVCLNASPVQLLTGGTWSGSSWVSSSGLFTPGEVADHFLTFTKVVGQCTSTDEIMVSVLPAPIVNAGPDQSFCSGVTVSLNGSAVSLNGGITNYHWNQSFVSNQNIQNPNFVAASTTTLSLTATDIKNCQATDAVVITVVPPPTVDAGNDMTVCTNSGAVTLTGQSPAGGTWTGLGVTSGGVFTPSTAGNIVLTYTYTNSANCSSSDTRTIMVVSPGGANVGSDVEVCLNAAPVQLTSGGTWSGSSWVTSAGLFTPGAVGTFPLTYSAVIGGCNTTASKTIHVLALPIANAGVDQSVCTGTLVQLNGTGSSTNGSISSYHWNQNFVSNQNIANPTFTGSSTVTLNLTVTDNKNCSSMDAVQVTVSAYPVVDAGADMTICTNGGAVTMTGHSPAGGTWSGTGVTSAGVFTPSAAGNIVLTYSYTNSSNCSATDTRTIQVIDPSSVNVGGNLEVCQNSAPFQLTTGGVWSGSSWVTSSGLFTPGAIGTYNLTYTIAVGGCTSTATKMIQVIALPVVNAGADQSACVGATVQLNGSGSSTNGAIASYHWSETFVSDQNMANPTFAANNTVTLNLTVTDVKNCSATDAVIVTVSPYPAVNAGNDISVCQNQSTVTLTGASPAGGTWSGAGISSGGVYSITSAGIHNVTYSYTNAAGCSSTDNLDITVAAPNIVNAGSDVTLCLNSPAVQLQSGGTWSGSSWVSSSGLFTPGAVGNYTLTYSVVNGVCTSTDAINVQVLALPTVNAGVDDAICEGNTYQLNGSASGGAGGYDYSWSHPALLNHPQYPNPVLSALSTTTLTLTVTDDNNCSAQDDVIITVVPMPIPSFTAPVLACENTTVSFVNTSTYAASYSWDFGNTVTSTVQNPSTIYSGINTYNVTLTAYNSAGCSESISEQVQVIGLPNASFDLSETVGCSPLQIDFDNNSTGYGLNYLWDLVQTTSNNENPSSLTYTATGAVEQYTISLTATNICGSSTDSETLVINPQPIADFDTSLSTQCSPVISHFSNLSVGNPTSYLWEFGDGETSIATQPAPQVYYTDDTPENYIVKLYAYNQCGQDVQEMTLTVMPNTIEPMVTPSVLSGCSPLFVQFANSTVGATQHSFNFDDGNTSNMISPAHIFNNAGQYEVYYYANDGCSFDTVSFIIDVLQTPTVAISVNESAVCPDEIVQFTSQTTGNVQQVVWNFGDGNSSNDFNPTHSFSNSDIYAVGATAIAQNGCEASASINVTIHPKPSAQLSLTSTIGCSPWNICPGNAAIGATIYSWDFGNGVVSSDANPCYEYTNLTSGVVSYDISLYVENGFGCSDETIQTVEVQPQPSTQFSLSFAESCFINEQVGVTVNTINTDSYQWFVNGNPNSNSVSPVFYFNTVGEHIVEVLTSNSYGCTDSHSQTFTVYPTPVVDVMPNTFNGCAPLTVVFENETINGVQYNWSFSNGQSSNSVEPSVTFDNSGNYDVQVTAISEYGCQSTQFFADMIEVFELPIALFSIDSNEEILYDTRVPFINSSEGAISYSWNFGDGYIGTEENPVHQYLTGGDYDVVLTAINQYGCEAIFENTVKIDNTIYVFVPSAFTPGTDGINDVFAPKLSSYDDIYEYMFVVTNRWGEVIFQTNDPKEGWSGDVNKGDYYVHNDLFNWTLTILYKNGQQGKRYKGEVVVLR